MQKPNLATWLAIVIGIFLVKIVLVEWVFDVQHLGPQAQKLKATVVCVLLIVATALLARRTGLLHHGGFLPARRKPRVYLLLLVPLAYPGGFYLARLDGHCFEDAASGLALLAATTAGAMLEETGFRGLLQGYLLKHYRHKSNNWICLVTAGIFAACHFLNLRHDAFPFVFQQVIYAFAMGLLFSALLIRVGNVWALGFVHGLLNFLSACGGSRATEPGQIPFVDHLISIGGFMLFLLPVVLSYWLIANLRPAGESSTV